MTPEAALAACRFLGDLPAMLLWGASAYLAVLVPPALATAVWHRLRRMRRLLTGLAIVATMAFVPVSAATMGAGWRDAAAMPVWHALLVGTSAGSALGLMAMAVSMLAAGVARRSPPCVTAVAAAIDLCGPAATGHAAMDEGGRGLLHHGLDALHLLGAGAWLGALVPLLVILPHLSEPRWRAQASVALRRFSGAGHGAVALALLTGAANGWLVLGRWPTDVAAAYQRLLLVKVGLVLAMVALALVNRYGLVPRMAGAGRAAATLALRRLTLVEIFLGAGAVALVAVFGLLDPAGG